MSLVDVGAADEFADRVMKVVEVGGVEIGVCRWGPEIFALRSRCPHQAAPLCRGFLQAGLSAAFAAAGPGPELEADAGEPMILCPWHRWEFSLRDGKSVVPGYRARTYPVRVDGDRVLIMIGRD
jgi:nitrite reductase/ring-hydroxylating ferredoxin subunit